MATFESLPLLPRLPRRPHDAHKGDCGRVLVVAGSRGMSGAAVLAATAALRGGAGLVRVAVPEGIVPIVAASCPCFMTAALSEDETGMLAPSASAAVFDLIDRNDVAVLGPGLGQGVGTTKVVLAALASQTPLVLDADALNVLVPHLENLKRRKGASVLTPHPGEFCRLAGCGKDDLKADREGLALRFAAAHGVVVVLKGAGTVVTDGKRGYINLTGNPGMATGGSGDVLAGLIAALIGQGLDAFSAAQLGVHVHGKAGDRAGRRLGQAGLIASDLLDELPAALESMRNVDGF